MSLPIIFVVLSIAFSALVEAGHDADTTVSSPESLPSCKDLNMVNATHVLNSVNFKRTLEYCSKDSEKENLNFGALVLLEVFNATSKEPCSFVGHSDEESKLIDCVKSATSTPYITLTSMKSNFGFNDSLSLQFRYSECKKSLEVSNCIQNIFSEKKLDANMKSCKDNIIRGFEVTSNVCFTELLRDDRGSGYAVLPNQSLIFSVTLMLIQVIVSSGY